MESSKSSDHDHTQRAVTILNEARNAVEWEIPPLLEAFYEEVVDWPDSNCWYFDDMFNALERLLVYYDMTEFGLYGDPSEAESKSLRQLIREGWESFLKQYNVVLKYSEEVADDEMGDEKEATDKEVTDDEMGDEATDNGEDETMDMTA
ncbi:hypothetical protein FMEXI_14335 [Fusarium mexicanum]|uniref:Uncharacterized protein n=1 Tax=Fusarium mexicanum TaxID=751941 RepID=A0A8H5I2X8_9HYPO|nr:hypothetical protein FMEXI_14335 [Fusarium mexicanum]